MTALAGTPHGARTFDDTVRIVTRAMVDGDVEAYVAVAAPDILIDVVVPRWRYQLVGHDALREALAQEFLPERDVIEKHVTVTADGVLVELGATGHDGDETVTWWDIHHVRIADGVVVEHISYCSGLVDAAQLKRMQAEAPRVRER